MADRIKLLPEVVANQIAAGEVVNRPSSVVKEMMENAIDAGARSVKVNFRDGGKELIQIVDDGCGMSPIDARMAFDRHATSKISSLDDIYALKTFGFRGEALASIAAVSQVELRTRQAEDEVGTLTTVNGGEFVSQTLAACPVGRSFMCAICSTTCLPAVSSSKEYDFHGADQVRVSAGRALQSAGGVRIADERSAALSVARCFAGFADRRCGGASYQTEPAGSRCRHVDRAGDGLRGPSRCRQEEQ